MERDDNVQSPPLDSSIIARPTENKQQKQSQLLLWLPIVLPISPDMDYGTRDCASNDITENHSRRTLVTVLTKIGKF